LIPEGISESPCFYFQRSFIPLPSRGFPEPAEAGNRGDFVFVLFCFGFWPHAQSED
jgi:hypothetical protein